MSLRKNAKAVRGIWAGCLVEVLMWLVVAPVLGVLLLLAGLSGDPLLNAGAVVLAVLFFCLYVLATWD